MISRTSLDKLRKRPHHRRCHQPPHHHQQPLPLTSNSENEARNFQPLDIQYNTHTQLEFCSVLSVPKQETKMSRALQFLFHDDFTGTKPVVNIPLGKGKTMSHFCAWSVRNEQIQIRSENHFEPNFLKIKKKVKSQEDGSLIVETRSLPQLNSINSEMHIKKAFEV